jgi:hypothetical protein
LKVTNGHATAIAEDGADRENDTFAKVDAMERPNQAQHEKCDQRQRRPRDQEASMHQPPTVEFWPVHPLEQQSERAHEDKPERD